METVKKLEGMMAEWFKGLPHLPIEISSWIVKNIWWLVTIGVILSVFGILSLIGATFLAGSVWMAYPFSGYATGYAFGAATISAVISLLFMGAETVIMAMAISPLKAVMRKGWTMLFITSLLQVASVVVAFVLSFSVSGLIGGLLGAAVGLYFLFNIRDKYLEDKKVEKK